ncbi:hypothetical protein ACWIID_17480 [Streptomyces phaeochromogenes]
MPAEQGVRTGQEVRKFLFGGVHRVREAFDAGGVVRQDAAVQDDEPVGQGGSPTA